MLAGSALAHAPFLCDDAVLVDLAVALRARDHLPASPPDDHTGASSTLVLLVIARLSLAVHLCGSFGEWFP